MKRGFYTIMAAQFFSSLADNALLIAAIQLMIDLAGPAWILPFLKFFFTVAYVVLAPFVGAFADSRPKGRVMFITNLVKILGCAMLFFHAWILPGGWSPYISILMAYTVVGIGAAAYSPAKYGIVTELLPPHQLVKANGWIEGLTVASIVLGFVLGGALISDAVAPRLLAIDVPLIDTGVNSRPEAAIVCIALLYLTAAWINLYVPNTGVDHHVPHKNPVYLIHDFYHCCTLLWRDKLGQITLATTTLFWGASATMQFIVLEWARRALGYELSAGTYLLGVTMLGVTVGSVLAAIYVPLRRAADVSIMGVGMGLLVVGMVFAPNVWIAIPFLILIGALGGFFLVPMNALLQHRGHILMGAGHSIAVQNFNENLSILAMLAIYSAMTAGGLSINTIVVLFGLFIAVSMILVRMRHHYNLAHKDPTHHTTIMRAGNAPRRRRK
jgi:MFS transporter, LPLT family, lysophospholipid transporter